MNDNGRTNDSVRKKSEALIAQRYAELQDKMQSCYEEFREARHLQVNVIAACGGLLGILTGASVLGIDSKEYEINLPEFLRDVSNNDLLKGILKTLILSITPRRILFWIVSFAFCVTFLYVAKIGIENVLRYFYIRNLSIRAHDYNELEQMEDVNGRGRLLVFSEFSSPILTSSPAHVGSLHTLLHFVCNYAAIGISIVFCLILVVLQFMLISERNVSDRILLTIICIIIIGTLVLYIYMAYHAEDVVQYAWDESHANHNNWKKKEDLRNNPKFLYRTSRQFRRVLCYYIYPRKNSIPSVFLMVAGYIFGCHMFDVNIRIGYLFLVWLIFDFSFYQARYMFNDIRGIQEDTDEYMMMFGNQTEKNDMGRHMRSKRKLGALLIKEMELWEVIHNDLDSYIEMTDAKKQEEKRNAEKKIYRKFINYTKIAIVLRLIFVMIITVVSDALRKHALYVLCLAGIIIVLTLVYEAVKANETIPRWCVIIIAALGFPLRFITGFSGMYVSEDIKWSMIKSIDIFAISMAMVLIQVFGCYVMLMLWYRQMLRRYRMTCDNDEANKCNKFEKFDFVRGKYNYIKKYVSGADYALLDKTDDLKTRDIWRLTGREEWKKRNKPWNVLFNISVIMSALCMVCFYIIENGSVDNIPCQSLAGISLFFMMDIAIMCISNIGNKGKAYVLLYVIGLLSTIEIFIVFMSDGLNTKFSIVLCVFYCINIFVYTAQRSFGLNFIHKAKESIIGFVHRLDMRVFGDLAHSYTCKK